MYESVSLLMGIWTHDDARWDWNRQKAVSWGLIFTRGVQQFKVSWKASHIIAVRMLDKSQSMQNLNDRFCLLSNHVCAAVRSLQRNCPHSSNWHHLADIFSRNNSGLHGIAQNPENWKYWCICKSVKLRRAVLTAFTEMYFLPLVNWEYWIYFRYNQDYVSEPFISSQNWAAYNMMMNFNGIFRCNTRFLTELAASK